MFDKNDRGQVGIGTLIVFIAMVLVAAIAAGVLINTAGFLQAQAEATGEETAEQVSDRVEVVSVVGTADDNDEIDDLNVSVRRAPGAGNIDLSNVVVEVFANGTSATLVNDGENEFTIEQIQGDEDNPETLASSDDRAEIQFSLNDDVGDAALAPGDNVVITITTAAGGTAFVEKRAPSTVESGQSYRL